MAKDRADVLVIGSGPAGAALAKRLADLGAQVVCLEQGDWTRASDFPTGPDEEGQLRRRWHSFSPNVRRLRQDYPVSAAGADAPEVEMLNAVGGGTLHWNCGFARLHPSDFRVSTLDGEADDWPIRYEDLAPYYQLNDREMGASGLAGDPANADQTPPLAPLPLWSSGERWLVGSIASGGTGGRRGSPSSLRTTTGERHAISMAGAGMAVGSMPEAAVQTPIGPRLSGEGSGSLPGREFARSPSTSAPVLEECSVTTRTAA